MNNSSTIPGILDEYCWEHVPGGWDCSVCFKLLYQQGLICSLCQVAALVTEKEVEDQTCTKCMESERVQA